jgi:enoyl-[acyl-carrier protein] reductase II
LPTQRYSCAAEKLILYICNSALNTRRKGTGFHAERVIGLANPTNNMNRITELFRITYPIIQGGMIWCSGWELAAAVSNAGGLGLIGSGSMDPDTLQMHIQKCKKATDKPFGVNVPLMFSHAGAFMDIIVRENVPVVFTSAGSPAKWTSYLKEHGIAVAHVIANTKFARKAEDSGVDVVVAEGFEAGGHNGMEETTTMALVPTICKEVKIPVIAAGGIATGGGMLAAFALGAEGVQIGTRFVASVESSAHSAFKEMLVRASDGDTMLALKKLIPVRLMKNKFYHDIKRAEDACAGQEELLNILGKGRARKGMFDGDMDEGELEIGQIAGLVEDILPAGQIIREIMREFNAKRNALSGLHFG